MVGLREEKYHVVVCGCKWSVGRVRRDQKIGIRDRVNRRSVRCPELTTNGHSSKTLLQFPISPLQAY